MAQSQDKLTFTAKPRRAAPRAAVVAMAVLLTLVAIPHAWARKATSGKVTLIFTNVTMGSSGYSGSNCDSNTYSSQCPSGACTCYVSGIVPVKVIAAAAGKPVKSGIAAAELFLTVDYGSATGALGCSPMYGSVQGLNKKLTEVVGAALVATVCPQKSSSGPFNIEGGWGVDFPSSVTGSGSAAGALNGANLKLTLAGTGVVQ